MYFNISRRISEGAFHVVAEAYIICNTYASQQFRIFSVSTTIQASLGKTSEGAFHVVAEAVRLAAIFRLAYRGRHPQSVEACMKENPYFCLAMEG
ncbi:MAG: hypothetical protein ABS920_09195 [Sporosarcina sp.]